jgi:hypothetical protein
MGSSSDPSVLKRILAYIWGLPRSSIIGFADQINVRGGRVAISAAAPRDRAPPWPWRGPDVSLRVVPMAISNPNGHYQGPNNQRSDAADHNAKPNFVHEHVPKNMSGAAQNYWTLGQPSPVAAAKSRCASGAGKSACRDTSRRLPHTSRARRCDDHLDEVVPRVEHVDAVA